MSKAKPAEAEPAAEAPAKKKRGRRPNGGPTNKEMVQMAIAAEKATPSTGALEFIKEKFGMDMSPGNFAATKSSLGKTGGISSGGKASDTSSDRSKMPLAPKKVVADSGSSAMMAVDGLADLISAHGFDSVKKAMEWVERVRG